MQDALQNLVNMVDSYTMTILLNIGIGIVLALGLNIITGVTGQLTLGHAAFMSIGAFASAIITLKFNLPFGINLIIAGLFSALVGAIIGYPILRLTGDYLAIATLGFAEIVKVVFLNLKITQGALGLTVPDPGSVIPLPIYVFLVTLLCIIAMSFTQNSRFGRALKAIRDDEIAAEAMGINTARYKVQAFAIGSFLAGLGGGLYAHVLAYINPSDFAFQKSIDILCMAVLGGLGSIPGTVLGASVLTIAPEFLRFMDQYRMLVYGVLLVVLMVFRPNGLMGGVDFTKLVKRAIGLKQTTVANQNNRELTSGKGR
ncbi:MAG TPA: branched-chain amino acid ABC transporter permease [Bacillota bacterium]|nr:branched-chain amino acid ABC transporter permease [Bacillota bacterium]